MGGCDGWMMMDSRDPGRGTNLSRSVALVSRLSLSLCWSLSRSLCCSLVLSAALSFSLLLSRSLCCSLVLSRSLSFLSQSVSHSPCLLLFHPVFFLSRLFLCWLAVPSSPFCCFFLSVTDLEETISITGNSHQTIRPPDQPLNNWALELC